METVVPLHPEIKWLEVGPVDAIPRLGARVVKTANGNIAVFRTRKDEIFALEDSCPHRGGPLSQGIVTGCQVICPLHDWCIRLEDGEAEPPDEGRTRRYPIRIDDSGIIHVSLVSE